MGFRRPVQLGVLLIALVVSVSMALAQEQGQQGPTKQPMGNGMSNEQMQMMHQQMVRGSQTSDTTTPTMPGQDAFGGHCQTNLSGPAKGAGLRRSGRELTPLGQGGRTVLFEDVAAVEVTVVVEVVVD